MIRWGVTAGAHDASLTVFNGKDIKFAAHAERSSGVKNDKLLNWEILNQALEYGQPKRIHWYETQWLKRLRQLRAGQYRTALDHAKSPHNQMMQFGYDSYACGMDDGLFEMFKFKPIKLEAHRHHTTHASAGYYTSPFTSASVLVVDSIGEFETLTAWRGDGRRLKKIFSQGYPNSVGLWYSAMTQRIGLKPNEDEYILMGWAALGDANRLKDYIFDSFFYPLEEGSLNIRFKQNLHRGCKQWCPELNTIQDYADIAAATQAVYEQVFEHLVKTLKNKTGQDNLVIMGGCALNCVANNIALQYFKRVWVMPNPGDAGSSLGAVLADHKDFIEWPGPYLGYNIKGRYPVSVALKELQTTGMVGVANGRAEFGPRALGNRSLLADPRGPDMKDKVNTVKRRQEFRPFAPVILEQYADDYFDGPCGPYMQFVSKTRRPDLYPAITHLDGTSRVQTVNKQQHPRLFTLLTKWHERTGCPMLLNTSLNIKGKPMVDTESDARNWQREYGVTVCTKET